MASTRKTVESQEELAKRGVLTHMEHIKSIGEALSKAVDTYLSEQKASEAEGNWQDDFAANVNEASKEFHRTLSESSQKTHNIYFGAAEEKPTTKTTGSGGAGRSTKELKDS